MACADRLHVLQLITQLDLDRPSGSPGHVMELSAALARRGVAVTMIAGRGASATTRAALGCRGVELIEVPYRSHGAFVKSLDQLDELLGTIAASVEAVRRCAADGRRVVLHAHHMPHSPIVGELADRHFGMPYLTTSHGSDLYEGDGHARYQHLLKTNRYGAYLVALNAHMMERISERSGLSARADKANRLLDSR